MARKRRKTVRSRYDAWLQDHPTAACLVVGGSVALALVGIFLFVTFSGRRLSSSTTSSKPRSADGRAFKIITPPQ